MPLALAMSVVAGCSLVGFGQTGGAYPNACESLGFGARQCAAIVLRAEAQLAIPHGSPTSVEILPPSAEGNVSLGGQMIARVRFHRAGMPDQTQEVWCVGVTSGADLACNADASIGISGGVDHDVPCTGEPPAGCATLPPTPRPAVVADARPLRVASLDVPLDHIGRYEVEVGGAGLPDGVLSTRSATLADPKPAAFWISDGIQLEVRPADPARPPVGSVYREPFDGVEPVKVFLVFDVTEVSPGAVLQVRDLVVE